MSDTRPGRQRGLVGSPLILILVGALVLVMLRFLPGALNPPVTDDEAGKPADRLDDAKHKAATPPEPSGPVLVQEPTVPDPAVVVAEPVQPVVETPVPPVREPRPEPPVAVAPAPTATPVPPNPVVREPVVHKPKPVSKPRVTKPVEQPKVVAKVETVPVAPVVVRKPGLRILVEAEVDDRAGLGAYTASQYALLLKRELESIAAGQLGAAAVRRGDPNMAFRDELKAGGGAIERLCRDAGAERLLLADLVVPNDGFSRMDSAYWPQVAYAAINCTDGRKHRRPKKRLEPRNRDSFEFQQHFAERSQNFVASQAYFLKP